MSDHAVAAAADRELVPLIAGHRDHAPNVVYTGDANDRCRSLVDVAVENGSGLVVVGIAGVVTRPSMPARVSSEDGRY